MLSQIGKAVGRLLTELAIRELLLPYSETQGSLVSPFYCTSSQYLHPARTEWHVRV